MHRLVTQRREKSVFGRGSNHPSSSIGLLLAGLVFAGCSSYEVQVGFDDATAKAQTSRFEVAIVESCSTQTLGGAPASPLRLVTFAAGEDSPALGELDARSYGLYARAIDAECAVVAAGCTPVVLGARGSGTLRVVLSGLNTPACDPGVECNAGQCVSVAGDGGADDAGPARTFCEQLGSDWGYNYCRDFDSPDEPFVFGWDNQVVDDGGELREDSNAVSAPSAFLASTSPAEGTCVNAFAEANVEGAIDRTTLLFQLRLGSMDESEPFRGGYMRLRFMDAADAEACSLVFYGDGTSGGVVELVNGEAIDHPFTVRFPQAFDWTSVRLNVDHEAQTFDVLLGRDSTYSGTQDLNPACTLNGFVVVSMGVQCDEQVAVGSGEVRLDDVRISYNPR